MAKKYMFIAGANSCGACAGLDGTISDGGIGPQHDNCHCQDVPVDDNDMDCPTVEILSVSFQTSGATSTVGGEIIVRCCDNTEISQSIEMDLGAVSPNIEDAIDAFHDFAVSEASELKDECPEGIPVWVEEGEEAGLA